MKHSHRTTGFTLIETLMTTVILVYGLVAVAQLFSYTIATNVTNNQRTAATILLAEKMEQLKSADIRHALWRAGGGLDPDAPVPGFFDYVSIDSNGALISDSTAVLSPYLRIWQISETVPRRVTVVVYAQRSGSTRARMELLRASTALGDVF